MNNNYYMINKIYIKKDDDPLKINGFRLLKKLSRLRNSVP